MSRLLSIAAVAAACLSLGGCAHESPAASGFAWSFQENPDEGVKLAYGQPYSDNVLLMMTCEPGSSRVMLSTLARGQADEIVLSAAGDRDRFAGQSMPDMFGGGRLVEARAATAAPSLKAFARTGDLALLEGRRRIGMAAAPREQAGVRRFFEACRA